MQEFICPNGRMSVNGVCPIFEGDDGQIKDFQTPKTFDQKYNDIEDIEKEREKSGFFKFDFEKDTESKNDNANNIINKNINYYNNFVEDKLGIPSNVQNALRFGSSAVSAFSGGSLMSVAAPFAIPFMIGAALNNRENNRVQDITMQDPQGDIQTINLQKAATGSSYSTGGIGTSAGASRDPAGTGGGSRQATSAGATNTGRTDGGWGW
jgi:hypothetical protein